MLRLFKTIQQDPREFGYKPRYYDAEREALEKRILLRQNRGLNDSEETRLRLRQEFSNYKRGSGQAGGYGGVSARLKTGSTIRLIIIIGLLCWLSYIVLEIWLPDFLEYLAPVEPEEYDLLEEYDH